MSYRIESLFLVFCGLFLLYFVMKPRTESFLGRVFPFWLKAFLTSLFEALFLSLILFGILGVGAHSGVSLIQQYPISFIVISGIGTALFMKANIAPDEFSTAL